jgi:DNA invertase Pin-like site-specific DNA recombinase
MCYDVNMTKRQQREAYQRERAAQKRVVAYYRVSTAKQGESGLGLEAQAASVAAYITSTGSTLVADYTETESGRHNDRAQLALAMAHAKRTKATLVIAKIDRLARNVAFIANLMESGVDFVACDMPSANKMTVHIMAAVAEGEALMISQRTKAGLAALKARGNYSNKLGRVVQIGNPDHLTDAHRRKGSAIGKAVRQRNKAEAYAHLIPLVHQWRAEGLSLGAIAKRLNERNEETRRGCSWNPAQVRRVLLMEVAPADRPLPFRVAA